MAKAAAAGAKKKAMTKTELINALVDATGVAKKEVKTVLESFIDVGHKQLKKNEVFVIPGFTKLTVVKKPATKSREGINPRTGEKITIKAKPARKVLRARPVKAAKDAVL